jgi:hypothetical protein
LKWFPEIAVASVSMASLDGWLAKSTTCPQEGIKMWLTELKMMFPEIKNEYAVGRIPAEKHEVKHPVAELAEMRGTSDGIIEVHV